MKMRYDTLTVEEALERLGSSSDGLTDEEASKRLEEYGPNAISENQRSPWISLLKKFVSPFPLMIEVAIIISMILRNWPDVAIITLLLVMNISVDFFQERKATNIIESLRKHLAVRARAKRGGQWKTVDARDIIPGDIVIVRGGDVIPADLKLVSGEELELDESALTGESLPVQRKVGDIAYSSAIVNQGEMQGLVVQTGEDTFFGRTASLAEERQQTSHFEKAVTNVGKFLIILAAVAILAIISVSLARHERSGDALLLVLTVAVASIPAALPAVLTVTMTSGATHLAKDGVLVRRLAAIEELASADVVCSDKTGTLTTGRLEMGDPVLYGGAKKDEVLQMAVLCSNYPATTDPIDKAVVEGAIAQGFDPESIRSWNEKRYVPANANSKRALVVASNKGRQRTIIKGTPQVVLAASTVDDSTRKKYLADVDGLARKGFRTLGVAYLDGTAEEERGMHLVGLLPLHDPPRPESAETIKAAGKLGIKVKMITGDNEAAAREIATEMELGGKSVTAKEIEDWSDDEFARRVEEYDVFSEVLPENKYRIVKALQESGHTVGMTGDGVNDSPALKRADVGIAVEGSTDVARGAADVVLTSPGLKVIINGVREGKITFTRMKNYVIYRVSETFRIIFFITIVILTFNVTPIGPHQIVLLAILNDIPILAIASDRAREAAGPESWGMKRLLLVASVLGATGLISSIVLFLLLHNRLPIGQLQTAMFLKLSISGHMLFFCARNRGPWWSSAPSRLLLAAILSTMAVSTAISAIGIGSFLPRLPIGYVGLVWAWCLVMWQVTDGVKLLTYRYVVHESDVGLQAAAA